MEIKTKKTNASNYSPPNVNYWGDRCCKAEAEIERLTRIVRGTDVEAQRWFHEVERLRAALAETEAECQRLNKMLDANEQSTPRISCPDYPACPCGDAKYETCKWVPPE